MSYFFRALADGTGGLSRVLLFTCFVVFPCLVGYIRAWLKAFTTDGWDEITGLTKFGRFWVCVHIASIAVWAIWAFSNMRL